MAGRRRPDIAARVRRSEGRSCNSLRSYTEHKTSARTATYGFLPPYRCQTHSTERLHLLLTDRDRVREQAELERYPALEEARRNWEAREARLYARLEAVEEELRSSKTAAVGAEEDSEHLWGQFKTLASANWAQYKPLTSAYSFPFVKQDRATCPLHAYSIARTVSR